MQFVHVETLYDEWSLLSQVSFTLLLGRKGVKSAGKLGKLSGYERLNQVRAGDRTHHGLEKGISKTVQLSIYWDDATGVFIGRGEKSGVDL